MNSNQFSKEQLAKIYNDQEFLRYISDYFTSYSHLKIDLEVGASEEERVDWKIYLKVVLANIRELFDTIRQLEKNVSFSYDENTIKSPGAIKGRLLVNEYVKNKTMVRIPKEYPCVVKEKAYSTPENEYATFIMASVIEKMQKLLDRVLKIKLITNDSSEKKELLECLDFMNAVLKRQPFISILDRSFQRKYRNGYPQNEKSNVEIRLAKGKVRNSYAYRKLFSWYELYILNEFSWASSQTIEALIYDEQFSNKLFELWCLYKIRQSFIIDFGLLETDKNPVFRGQKEYIYRLKNLDGSYIEIYYQKGAGLYWDDTYEQHWYYVDSNDNKGLIGIPDISIKYVGEKGNNITLIDLKNRVRDAGNNSEEIYKVIGYFSNFEGFLKNMYCPDYHNQGVLIFRNDVKPFERLIQNDSGEQILTLSAGVSNNKDVSDGQFRRVCQFILDNHHMSGTKAESLLTCGRILKSHLKNFAGDEEENEYYEMSAASHRLIEAMFTKPELKKELDRVKEELKEEHFPHIWDSFTEKMVDTLAMADALFDGVTDCEGADFAPICLEYCRAVEILLNEYIIRPFVSKQNVASLISANRNYKQLGVNRDLTLGECMYLLNKCNASYYPTSELKTFVESRLKTPYFFWNKVLPQLENMNSNYRRKSAHTSIMNYDELKSIRQIVLGIGNVNIFYSMLDKR